MALFQPTALFRGAEYITPEYLREHGIRALILDVDNTLTGHGSQQLPPPIAAWLQTMKESGVKLRVASNNMPGRVRPFAQKIGLPYSALCCKPAPFGLWHACREMGVRPCEAALVGDQVFTDAMGANLAGVQMLLVQPMYHDIKPLIRLRRHLEKPVLRRYYEKGGRLL